MLHFLNNKLYLHSLRRVFRIFIFALGKIILNEIDVSEMVSFILFGFLAANFI